MREVSKILDYGIRRGSELRLSERTGVESGGGGLGHIVYVVDSTGSIESYRIFLLKLCGAVTTKRAIELLFVCGENIMSAVCDKQIDRQYHHQQTRA